MILLTEKTESEHALDALFDDEPPAYSNDSNSNQQPSWSTLSSEKSQPLNSSSQVPASTSSRSEPPGSDRGQGSSYSPFRNAAAWFSFGALSRTDKEIKATVLGLVRDVVKQSSSPAAISILQSCAEACRARQLPFHIILQEPSIEGHTPLYWAILKRKATDPPQEVGIMDMLMSFPLTDATRSDAATACIIQSDNILFQRLRRSPGWRSRATNGADEMLLGEIPEDSVTVTNDPKAADNGAFKATFRIAEFQKRMRVSKTIRLDFIARERLWALTFSRAAPRSASHRQARHGSGGYLNLYLLESSPGTPFKGRINITESTSSSNKGRARRPIVIPLKTGLKDLTAQSQGRDDGICVSLDDVPGGASLQYDGSSFIDEDGSLSFDLEAILTKEGADGECKIM